LAGEGPFCRWRFERIAQCSPMIQSGTNYLVSSIGESACHRVEAAEVKGHCCVVDHRHQSRGSCTGVGERGQRWTCNIPPQETGIRNVPDMASPRNMLPLLLQSKPKDDSLTLKTIRSPQMARFPSPRILEDRQPETKGKALLLTSDISQI